MAQLIMTIDSDEDVPQPNAEEALLMDDNKAFFDTNDSDEPTKPDLAQEKEQEWRFADQLKLEREETGQKTTMKERVAAAL